MTQNETEIRRASRDDAAEHIVPATPSPRQIDALHAAARTPERVRRHERRVALTALRLARRLTSLGLRIDRRLLAAACLCHDLRRTDGGLRHAATGARALRIAGFPAVAALVARHFDLGSEPTTIENQLLYLADKMTLDDRICSLDEREARMSASVLNDQAKADCRRRLDQARALLARFETLIGESASAVANKKTENTR